MKRILLSVIILFFCTLCFGQSFAKEYMENPSKAIEDAQVAFSSGDYKKAITLVELYNALSDSSYEKDLLAQAQSCLNSLEQAQKLEAEEDYSGAVKCYKSILEINPNDKNVQSKYEAAITKKDNYTETVYGINLKMISVKGGDFLMGGTSEQGEMTDSDEVVIRRVRVGDFFIGQFEVTQFQWEAVMGTSISRQRDLANPSGSLYGTGADYPMYYVSWEEASEFCRRLSLKTGKNYSLPTEAEWEYAARGGQKSNMTKYSGGNSLDRVAWYTDNSTDGMAHPVGLKEANELDLYDMNGNVEEWCYDRYSDLYAWNDLDNPTGPSTGSFRVFRGGCWRSLDYNCRISNRDGIFPGIRKDYIGFRVVCRP